MQLHKNCFIIIFSVLVLSNSIMSMELDDISPEVPTQITRTMSDWFNEKWGKTKNYWNIPKIAVEQNGEPDLSVIKKDVIQALRPGTNTAESTIKASSHKEVIIALVLLTGAGFASYTIINRVLLPYYRKIMNKSTTVDNNEMEFENIEQ